MGAQILEGPQIGEVYGNYNNVISIRNVNSNKISVGSVLYVRVRNLKKNENFAGVCLDIYRNPVFSTVDKVFVSSSNQPCD
jgi:hypothetical protein